MNTRSHDSNQSTLRLIMILSSLLVLLLSSCQLPPQDAWRAIQSDGLIPYLMNENTRDPTSEGGLFGWSQGSADQRLNHRRQGIGAMIGSGVASSYDRRTIVQGALAGAIVGNSYTKNKGRKAGQPGFVISPFDPRPQPIKLVNPPSRIMKCQWDKEHRLFEVPVDAFPERKPESMPKDTSRSSNFVREVRRTKKDE